MEEEEDDDDDEDEDEDVRRTRHPGYKRGINPPNTRVTATKADVRMVCMRFSCEPPDRPFLSPPRPTSEDANGHDISADPLGLAGMGEYTEFELADEVEAGEMGIGEREEEPTRGMVPTGRVVVVVENDPVRGPGEVPKGGGDNDGGVGVSAREE